MKYFLDTEFIEGFHKPLFGKRRHFIDLISIGIVREDGKEYYAISDEFHTKDADQWVKDNIIEKLPKKRVNFSDQGGDTPRIKSESFLYKSNANIADEVRLFFGCYEDSLFWRAPPEIEVYGYYADYDWVLFCSLFGRMIDLPKGFPMYCRDLKQIMDEKVASFTNSDFFTHFHQKEPLTFSEKLSLYKAGPTFPKQRSEHDALEDAKWNRDVYNYLERYRVGTALDNKG